MLQALNFLDKLNYRIKLCITTASFSIQVNGELAGYFRSERGIRQGCSLSPYLFVICMNVLSKKLDRAVKEKKIGYHPYCQNTDLTHLCFVDDLMVFSDGNKRSIEGILKVFTEFAHALGLKITLEKSTIYMAGVTEVKKQAILEQFPLIPGNSSSPVLGSSPTDEENDSQRLHPSARKDP